MVDYFQLRVSSVQFNLQLPTCCGMRCYDYLAYYCLLVHVHSGILCSDVYMQYKSIFKIVRWYLVCTKLSFFFCHNHCHLFIVHFYHHFRQSINHALHCVVMSLYRCCQMVLVNGRKILMHNCWSLVRYQRGHDPRGFSHTHGNIEIIWRFDWVNQRKHDIAF